MPATSKAQQRLFGLAYAIKKGDMERSDADAKAIEIADSMSLKDLKKFAETDHEGLPDKVKESLVNEGKGLSEASKLIKNLRDKVYPKLNDDELSEFKKEMVEHLGGTIEENLSPGNIGGMGPVGFPSNFNGAADGSGDVPAGRGDAEEEYKKKKKEREEELKKNKNESMIFTDFNQFLNEEYQANGKYNTVAKVRKKLGPSPSEKEVAKFVIANLKDVTGIDQKELKDSYKTDLALDKIADIAAFYKFDDVEWNGEFQDAINSAPFEWEVDESLVNEAKTISFAKASMLGSKLLNKIKIGTIIDTKGGQYEVTGFGQQANAFKEFEATIDGKEVKVKLTAMYGLKLEVTDDVRSARFNKEEEINSIILESVVNEGKFDNIADLAKSLHFEMDPKTAEEKKIELGRRQGEINKRKQIEGGNYSLRRFRKEIGYWDGNKRDQEWAEDVFAGPEHYNTVKSTLGAGPHKKAAKKIKWTQKKYDQWLEDVAANGGAEHAFDMAQNAKHERGLVYWVKKNLTYDETPLERIQYDIEALAESLQEAKASNAREDLGYVAFMEEMSELNSRDIQKAYSDAVDVLEDKGMTEKQAVGFLNSPHGKYMGEYVAPANDYSLDAFLDKLDEYYNERMLKKLAKDFEKLG